MREKEYHTTIWYLASYSKNEYDVTADLTIALGLRVWTLNIRTSFTTNNDNENYDMTTTIYLHNDRLPVSFLPTTAKGTAIASIPTHNNENGCHQTQTTTEAYSITRNCTNIHRNAYRGDGHASTPRRGGLHTVGITGTSRSTVERTYQRDSSSR